MNSLIQTFLVAMAALTAGDMVEGWYSPEGFTESFVKMSLKDHLENVKKMDIRNDDIFVCAFPRSGTTTFSFTVCIWPHNSIKQSRRFSVN